MQIRSKFPSTCMQCGGAIAVGELIEWAPGTKPTHVTCPEAPVVEPGLPMGGKSRFVLAMEQAGQNVSVRAPLCPRPGAVSHFVKLVVAYGTRPASLVPPEQATELVLSVGPDGRTMERALVLPGEAAYYLRFNGGALSDHTVNNVTGSEEIGWVIKWSAPIHMALEGLRHG